MHSISVLMAFCIIRGFAALTLNKTLLTYCVHTDITPCFPFILHAVREQIAEMEKAGWLAIDPGYEEQLAYACFLLGGHVPYYDRCLECSSPDPQYQFSDCGPIALQVRSSTWGTACAFYCPPSPRESSPRARDATNAPVLNGSVSSSLPLVLTSAVTARPSAATSPSYSYFAPEQITPESDRQLHLIVTSRSTQSRRRPEDAHEVKQVQLRPALVALGDEHDSFMNYVSLSLSIAVVVLLVLLLVLLGVLFFFVWRAGLFGRFSTSLRTHLQLRAQPQPRGEAAEYEMEAGLSELEKESAEELEPVSTSSSSLASTTPSTATNASSRVLSGQSEHAGRQHRHAQPQRARAPRRDRAQAQRHNSSAEQHAAFLST